jgi:hypothetical protein
MAEIKNSSYDYANTNDFVDLLLTQFKNSQNKEKVQVDVTDFLWHNVIPIGAFAVGQEDILYRMCGYVIKSLIGQSMLKCKSCVEMLRHHGSEAHPSSALVKQTNYKENAQFEVSDEVFQMLRLVEFNMRKWKSRLINTTDCLESLINNRILPCMSSVILQTCHDIKNIILKKFSWMRLKQLSQTLNGIVSKPKDCNSQLSSKTSGEKYLAQNYTPKPKVSRKEPVSRSHPFKNVTNTCTLLD